MIKHTETLNKMKIAELIHRKLQCSFKEARDMLDMLLEEIKLSLEDGEAVKISGFGQWQVKEKHSRIGRNPHTGEGIVISERRVVSFYPSTKLRSVVNKSKKKKT